MDSLLARNFGASNALNVHRVHNMYGIQLLLIMVGATVVVAELHGCRTHRVTVKLVRVKRSVMSSPLCVRAIQPRATFLIDKIF